MRPLGYTEAVEGERGLSVYATGSSSVLQWCTSQALVLKVSSPGYHVPVVSMSGLQYVQVVSMLTVLTISTAPGVQAQRVVPAMDVEGAVAFVPLRPSTGEVLYDQTENPDEDYFPSQEFETDYAAFNSQGADDFVVPVGETWNVAQVEAIGAYREGDGPVTLADVYFYADTAGRPGGVLAAYADIAVDDADSTGTLVLALSTALALPEGTYWVSAVADMDAATYGQWFWNKQATTTPVGAEVHWRNPGDGFDTGCTDWQPLVTACGDSDGLDTSFRLVGNVVVANEDGAVPLEFVVASNYPNPLEAATVVEFGLPEAAHVTVTVFDVLGRHVETLLDASRAGGYHRVVWEAHGVPSGIYFCRVESGGHSRVLRMTLVR